VRRLGPWCAVLVAGFCLPSVAAAQGIDEFPVPDGSGPLFITTGHDGRLWFALGNAAQIGRMSTSGELQQSVAAAAGPIDLVAGPNGSMYWTTPAQVQRRAANGGVTSQTVSSPPTAYAIATTADRLLYTRIVTFGGSDYFASLVNTQLDLTVPGTVTSGLVPGTATSPRLTDVTLGPDGKLWFTVYESASILRRPVSGAPDLKNDLAAGSLPYRIAVGPDGAMWFTEYGANRIGRISVAGVVTEYDLPRPNSGPTDIVAGPDGALWFTEYNPQGNAIGRITTDGKITEYPVPTAASNPWGIAVGPDGNIWFTESATSKVGRLDPSKVQPLGGGGGGGGAGTDRTRPAFQGKVRLSRKRFSVGRAPTPFSIARAVPAGTTFQFALSEPARVTLKIERRLSGRRVRGRCRAGARSGKRCKLWKSTGRSLTRQGLQGPNSIAFSGRLGRKALAIGAYRALITATDAAGNRSRTAALGFAIVPKGR
jgi:virginiamycin B lyase